MGVSHSTHRRTLSASLHGEQQRASEGLTNAQLLRHAHAQRIDGLLDLLERQALARLVVYQDRTRAVARIRPARGKVVE